jgi:hypothetical protein
MLVLFCCDGTLEAIPSTDCSKRDVTHLFVPTGLCKQVSCFNSWYWCSCRNFFPASSPYLPMLNVKQLAGGGGGGRRGQTVPEDICWWRYVPSGLVFILGGGHTLACMQASAAPERIHQCTLLTPCAAWIVSDTWPICSHTGGCVVSPCRGAINPNPTRPPLSTTPLKIMD